MGDTIKKITLKSGRTRYRFVVDIGDDPVTGKRRQKTLPSTRSARPRLSLIASATRTARGRSSCPQR